MTTVLKLFNGALMELGEERTNDTGAITHAVSSLAEIKDDTIEYALGQASWNFALKEVKLDADTGNVTPNYGMTYAFLKPTDWVRTVAISAYEYYNPPLAGHQYQDAHTNFEADVNPIYLKYVSNDTGAGLDLGDWPEDFARYVQVLMAERVCQRLTSDEGLKEELRQRTVPRALRNAKNKDAINEGTKFRRRSAWNQARGGRDNRERGNPNRFTG